MPTELQNLITQLELQKRQCQQSRLSARNSRLRWWLQSKQSLIEPSSLLTSFSLGFILKTPLITETDTSQGSVLTGVLKTLAISTARERVLKMMGHE
jgi:hypothetical protein